VGTSKHRFKSLSGGEYDDDDEAPIGAPLRKHLLRLALLERQHIAKQIDPKGTVRVLPKGMSLTHAEDDVDEDEEEDTKRFAENDEGSGGLGGEEKVATGDERKDAGEPGKRGTKTRAAGAGKAWSGPFDHHEIHRLVQVGSWVERKRGRDSGFKRAGRRGQIRKAVVFVTVSTSLL
jgi:hypothetical protein